MPGTAFNGSLWVNAAEMFGLMLTTIAVAGVGGVLAAFGMAKEMDEKDAAEDQPVTRTRVPLNNGSVEANLSGPAQKMVMPSVVQDTNSNGSTP